MSTVREFNADKLLVKIYDSRDAMGQDAAAEVIAKIKELLSEKEEISMIFAAAPSQNEFLASLVADKDIDWNRVTAFHMDEYIGLDKNAPQAFGNFLRARIFDKVPFKAVHYIDGNVENIESEADRYAQLLKNTTIDIICMGIGENGHIAFNDPPVADFKDSKLVKVVELDDACKNQQVNDGAFASVDLVPTHALTLTIPALMSGENLFCMVPAITKAPAVKNTVYGEISEACPASILRTHENAILYLDPDSSSML